jgi:hypothetical protein
MAGETNTEMNVRGITGESRVVSTRQGTRQRERDDPKAIWGSSFGRTEGSILQDEPPLCSGIQECKPDGPPNFVSDENTPDCLRKTEEKI